MMGDRPGARSNWQRPGFIKALVRAPERKGCSLPLPAEPQVYAILDIVVAYLIAVPTDFLTMKPLIAILHLLLNHV